MFYLSQNKTVPQPGADGWSYYTMQLDPEGCFGECDENGLSPSLPKDTMRFVITFDPSLFEGEKFEHDGYVFGIVKLRN